MATDNERKALWFLAIVALSGSAVRLWRSTQPAPPVAEASAITRQVARVDSARSAPKSNRGARTTPPRRPSRDRAGTPGPPSPPAATPPPPTLSSPAVALVDLDRADSTEIEGLPGIGPALARRIVEHRNAAGPFGGIEALCDVRGIGPALVEKLRPLVTFTAPRRPVSDECGGASRRARKTSVARSRKSP